MIARGILGVCAAALLLPHEPDLGFGHPAAAWRQPTALAMHHALENLRTTLLVKLALAKAKLAAAPGGQFDQASQRDTFASAK